VSDILRVARTLKSNPEKLVMGSRVFDRNVPFRSLVGNNFTSSLLHLITGKRIKDTQTGLRGLPMSLMEWMSGVPLNGYDFEMEILLGCLVKQMPILEVEIETIYLNRNQSSHFNPALDSLRIYAVILRYVLRLLGNLLPFKMNKDRHNHYMPHDHTV
jgi:hypothetical protein